MDIESYFSSVTSEDIFCRKFGDENGRPLRQLKYSAASKWGREHLFSCRVIRHVRQSDTLPSLLKHKPSRETIPPKIQRFLKGPEHGELNQSEHFLIQKYNILGQIWAALATFKVNDERRVFDPIPNIDEAVVMRPTRVRRITSHGDYVDSGEMQIDSSSPIPESSPVSSLSSYIGSSHNRFKVTEDGTLRLISCVIRVILIYAVQNYVCFLEYQISDSFIAQLESGDPDEFIHVYATGFLDINANTGRQHILSNLSALVNIVNPRD
ncbi:hypothetical protein E4U43_001446 [Claviceps pusilla]|uniref:Uncharacterized protein n=1 Tax=Claviceps pusilla TaxID=123648 RepID=A0A9P7NA76_9HYPO|nr:hypothetical protein E4U43_001446 [Claviceps pusilla]